LVLARGRLEMLIGTQAARARLFGGGGSRRAGGHDETQADRAIHDLEQSKVRAWFSPGRGRPDARGLRPIVLACKPCAIANGAGPRAPGDHLRTVLAPRSCMSVIDISMTSESHLPLSLSRIAFEAPFHDENHGYDGFGLHPPTLERVLEICAPIYDRIFR
jgi:hypothetical protein